MKYIYDHVSILPPNIKLNTIYEPIFQENKVIVNGEEFDKEKFEMLFSKVKDNVEEQSEQAIESTESEIKNEVEKPKKSTKDKSRTETKEELNQEPIQDVETKQE